MKKACFPIVAFILAFSLTGKSDDSPFSEGFEAGNYSGWTVTAEYGGQTNNGSWQYRDGSNPAVITPKLYPFDPLTNPYIIQDIGFVSDGTAPEGSHYLKLTTGGGSGGGHYEVRPFTAPNGDPYLFLDRNYGVVLSREFSIADGQALSLWVKFTTGEWPPAFDYDDLQVRIDGATIFRLSPSSLDRRTGYPPQWPGPWSSGWQQITWTPPSPGQYTLSLASFQDDQEFSSASFDGIMIVPEPATGIIGVLGLALLGRSKMVRRIL